MSNRKHASRAQQFHATASPDMAAEEQMPAAHEPETHPHQPSEGERAREQAMSARMGSNRMAGQSTTMRQKKVNTPRHA